MFVGFVVLADGFHVDEVKICATQECSTPKIVIGVCSFHGLATFYCNFVAILAEGS